MAQEFIYNMISLVTYSCLLQSPHSQSLVRDLISITGRVPHPYFFSPQANLPRSEQKEYWLTKTSNP